MILDADGTVMTTLNPVGSVIWRALDGERDTAARSRKPQAEFVFTGAFGRASRFA